jgi:hypothetical protein
MAWKYLGDVQNAIDGPFGGQFAGEDLHNCNGVDDLHRLVPQRASTGTVSTKQSALDARFARGWKGETG